MPLGCNACTAEAPTVCSACKSGFNFNATTKSCDCTAPFAVDSNGDCKCNSPNTPVNGQCFTCFTGCSECSANNVCQTCATATQRPNVAGNQCIACNIPKCVQCSTPGKCSKCEHNLIPNANGDACRCPSGMLEVSPQQTNCVGCAHS